MRSVARLTLPFLGLLAVFAVAGGALLWWRTGRTEAAVKPRPAEVTTGAESVATSGPQIRLAMSAAFVSESGVGVYEKIAEYLTRKTGIQAKFISGLAYGTINSMLEEGALHCGFVCGLPYVMLHDREQPAARLIAAPIMKAPRYHGQPKYYSDLIVRKDSPYRTIYDLKGKTYVYNDELSNSGYNLPRYRLLQLGLTRNFFGKLLRSGSHEESIRMVAAGEADASFVDSLVLDFDREKGYGHAREVRVIESVGPAGICPLVASAKVPADVVDKLQRELTTMHEDPEGRRILDEALLERFAIVDDKNYDDIRAMRNAAEKAGFTVIR
ncbi:MAG TPA: PhnD/SsuA/transferrin family substrate-binding protein [Polyangia bacterium]|jgi:phosphonate transport system substrate-binding protein|nr:PhnD/SsuA/transferrin family substrate-binding protein [Polyangia bacterium]